MPTRRTTDTLRLTTDFMVQVPNRIVVLLLKEATFNGAITENPFFFGKFNLKTTKLIIAGEQYPYETLKLDHDAANKDLRGYHRFLSATGCLTRGHGNLVRANDWGHGKQANMFVFDMTGNNSVDSPVLNPKQSGDVRPVLDFGANPVSNLTILVYGEFENMLQINGAGTVAYDVHQ